MTLDPRARDMLDQTIGVTEQVRRLEIMPQKRTQVPRPWVPDYDEWDYLTALLISLGTMDTVGGNLPTYDSTNPLDRTAQSLRGRLIGGGYGNRTGDTPHPGVDSPAGSVVYEKSEHYTAHADELAKDFHEALQFIGSLPDQSAFSFLRPNEGFAIALGPVALGAPRAYPYGSSAFKRYTVMAGPAIPANDTLQWVNAGSGAPAMAAIDPTPRWDGGYANPPGGYRLNHAGSVTFLLGDVGAPLGSAEFVYAGSPPNELYAPCLSSSIPAWDSFGGASEVVRDGWNVDYLDSGFLCFGEPGHHNADGTVDRGAMIVRTVQVAGGRRGVYCATPPRPWLGQPVKGYVTANINNTDNSQLPYPGFAAMRARVDAMLDALPLVELHRWLEYVLPYQTPPSEWLWKVIPLASPWQGWLEYRIQGGVCYLRGFVRWDDAWNGSSLPQWAALVPDEIRPHPAITSNIGAYVPTVQGASPSYARISTAANGQWTLIPNATTSSATDHVMSFDGASYAIDPEVLP